MVCFAVAVIATLQVYPFIGLADGFQRWVLAKEINESGRILSETLLSPVIPYIQALTLKITDSFALYTVLQAAAFYYAIGVLVFLFVGDIRIKTSRVAIPLWILIALALILFPPVYVFPLMLTDSAPVFSLMVMLCATLLRSKNVRLKGILLAILTFLCVGIRINSIIMIVFLSLVLVGTFLKKRDRSYLLLAFAVSLGCALGVLIPRQFTHPQSNAATLGMTWELVGIVKDSNDSELADALSQYGNVDEAVRRYGDPFLNSIVWDYDPPFPAMKIAGKGAKGIVSIYFEELINHPKRFIKNKLYYIDCTLGIHKPLISSTRGVHSVDSLTESMGAMNTKFQWKLRNIFFEYTDGMSLISLRPWVAVILSFVTLAICKFLRMGIKQLSITTLMSVAYYSSFLLNTQAFEFRYYAPCFYMLLCVIVCGIIRIIAFVMQKASSMWNENSCGSKTL